MLGSIECIHDVDDSKFESMASKTWCDLETPVVLVPLEYKLRDRDSFSNGYFMVTRGAAYIFKSRFLGQPELLQKFHMLNMSRIVIDNQALVFSLRENQITIKTEDTKQIALAMLTILYEAVYGVTNIQLPDIQSHVSLPPIEVTERPKSALKWRALFLSHYYNVKGEQLYTLDYFDKWEAKQKNVMVIGPSLHPGNFAEAYGHAIAWETKADSVAFQSFASTKFHLLIHALLLNAQTIGRIAFTDYKPKKLPVFNFSVSHTNVKVWWFLRCCSEIILSWAQESRNLPLGLTDVVISNCKITANQFSQIVNLFEQSNAVSNMTHFEFSRMDIPDFPFSSVTKLCSFATNLEMITARGLDVDASQFFKAICQAQSPIKIIHLTHMQYRSPINPQDTLLPPTILNITVSSSAFTSQSLCSLLVTLTCRPQQIPFVFQASNLLIKQQCYIGIGQMNFDICQPNILEIDWSGNDCPAEASRSLFAFLFTQKRLRLLNFNNVKTDNPTQFMQYIIQLAQPLNLLGLDLSCKFPPQLYAQFLQALVSVPSLRHLDVSNSESGDQGLAALDQLIKGLPNLVELTADGFRPQNPAAICAVWNDISLVPTLKASDLPVEDMRNLGMQPHRLDQQTQKAFAILKNKSKPSTTPHRVEVALMDIRAKRQPDFSPDVFEKACALVFNDTDNDQETNPQVNEIDE